jgi:2-polyprenyl-6-methoxyphenol hydroxylase-like FAD-dependent oxidoreductase
MAFGCNVRDYIDPVNCWASYFSIDQDLIKDSKLGHGYSAVGGRFLAVSNDPAGGNRVLLMGIHPRDKLDVTLPFREAMNQGEETLKRFIAQHYKGAGWIAEEVMEAVMGSKDFYANEMVQVKVPSLYKGRVVLVGDAGYAPGPTGTGTTLAMTGAYVLAGEVGKHNGDLAAGLKAYEEQMRPIINDMQKIPPMVPGLCAPQTAWGIWLRNNIFAFISWTNILKYVQRFSGGSFAGTDKYGISDYDWVAARSAELKLPRQSRQTSLGTVT